MGRTWTGPKLVCCPKFPSLSPGMFLLNAVTKWKDGKQPYDSNLREQATKLLTFQVK